MVLFDDRTIINLLDKDSTANYLGKIVSTLEANWYFDRLFQNILWESDKVVIFGKHIVTKRKVAWYGDRPYSYTYSNSTKRALEWTRELSELKQLVEEHSGAKFNSCLLNLYHNGAEGMGWHSDDEYALGRNNIIASLSLGSEREFLFKHKHTQQKISVTLEHGSLLVMKDATQTNWLHSLPKSKKITCPRINLTFRTILR